MTQIFLYSYVQVFCLFIYSLNNLPLVLIFLIGYTAQFFKVLSCGAFAYTVVVQISPNDWWEEWILQSTTGHHLVEETFTYLNALYSLWSFVGADVLCSLSRDRWTEGIPPDHTGGLLWNEWLLGAKISLVYSILFVERSPTTSILLSSWHEYYLQQHTLCRTWGQKGNTGYLGSHCQQCIWLHGILLVVYSIPKAHSRSCANIYNRSLHNGRMSMKMDFKYNM